MDLKVCVSIKVSILYAEKNIWRVDTNKLRETIFVYGEGEDVTDGQYF